MKILLLCYENINGNNGGVRQVIELARHLQRLGHTVALCAPRIETTKKSPVPIYYIPVVNIKRIRYISYLFISFIFLPLIFLRFKPSMTIYFLIHYNIAPFLIFKLSNCPFLLYINGIAAEEYTIHNHIEKWFFPLLNKIDPITINSAEKILTTTIGIKNHLIRRCAAAPDTIQIIKCGVDTESFVPKDKKCIRSELGLPRESFIIGFHGGLFPWHGVDYLVKAAPLILQILSTVYFVIAGTGPMLKSLQKMVQEMHLKKQFIFTGTIPFDTIPAYVGSFDIGINFFKSIRTDPGNPIKMYEYMACEVPVVASNAPGYGDFLETVKAGISTDPENSEELAQNIVELLKNPALRDRMGKAGRKEVTANHTWLHRAHQIDRLL